MVRQDAWSKDEDLLLAEVVLRHIRDGGTQLAAFEEVAEKLSRTSAACGFRWNSTIRKQYESAIAKAKEQRKKYYTRSEDATAPDELAVNEANSEGMNIDTDLENAFVKVIEFLQQQRETLYENEVATTADQQEDINRLKETVEELENEKTKVENELEEVKNRYQDLEQRYQLIIQAMEKATAQMN